MQLSTLQINDLPVQGKALQLLFADAWCWNRVPALAEVVIDGILPGLNRMAYKETFWMACDSTEQLRAEYGPFHTRAEAEREAGKLGFGYLLRYEHLIGENEDIKEVRCIFIELQPTPRPEPVQRLHTRCASCGESAIHDQAWQAEVWADIHEFEHSRHRVRLFQQTRAEGLKEIAGWRDACA